MNKHEQQQRFESNFRPLAKKQGWSELKFIAVTELLFKLAKIEMEIRKDKSKMKEAA